MTFNPDNLIFFYLILAIMALAVGLTVYAASPRRHDHHDRKRQ